MIAEHIKAVVTERQAQLIFALGVKAAVAPVTGAEGWVLVFFAGDNFRMNFERLHENSPWR